MERHILTCLLVLGIIKTNGLIALSRYPIKYLELDFVSINFKITILSTLTSQMLLLFCRIKTFLLLFLSLQISTLLFYQKQFVISYYLIDMSIFLKIS